MTGPFSADDRAALRSPRRRPRRPDRRVGRSGFDGAPAFHGRLARPRRGAGPRRRHGRSRPAPRIGRRGRDGRAGGRRARACRTSFCAWTGPKPATGIQEAARKVRYRLLVAAAKQAGCTHLVTGHTLDDQAETVLMRLAAGTGLTGLAGMRAAIDRDGIRHVRPLLDVRKAALVDACRREGWPFVEDPSNADERLGPGALAQAAADPRRGRVDPGAPGASRRAGAAGRGGPRHHRGRRLREGVARRGAGQGRAGRRAS